MQQRLCDSIPSEIIDDTDELLVMLKEQLL